MKKLEIEQVTRQDLPVMVYRLRGTLTNSHESYAFLEEISEQAHENAFRVVVNLEKLDALTSAGVGILAACYTSIHRAGGRMALACVPARTRAILKVVHLLEILGDSPTEEEAVRAAAQ